MVHGSQNVPKEATKKRKIPMVTCTECHSTFLNKTKMKKHVNEEHEKEERQDEPKESPPRKESKTEDLNERIVTEIEEEDNTMEETQIEKEANEAKKVDEVLDLRRRIYDQGQTLYNLQQEKDKLVKENKHIKEKANTEVRQLEEYIQQEAKAVREKVKNFERTMVQQIEVIERQNEEIERMAQRVTKEGDRAVVQEEAGQEGAQAGDITTLQANKSSGYSRAGPQNGAIPKTWFSSKGHKSIDKQSTQKQTCTECPETRFSEVPMNAHMSCHREPGIHMCDDCSYKSNEKSHLRNHLKHTRHTGTFKEYICHECRLEFQSEQEQNNHKETHKQDGAKSALPDQGGSVFECPICGYTGNSKSKIEKHMECHDNNEEDSTFLCNECPFQSMNRDQLLEHLETKHDKHICNTCNIACRSKNDLNKHIGESHKSHKPCREFATNSCSYKSECKYRHIKLKHNEQICYTSGKRTVTINDLMTHIKNIHGNQPCTRYAKGQCDRGSGCWYYHSKTPINNSNQSERLQGFQKVLPAQNLQIQVHNLSEEGRRQIVVQETQKIVTQMMPELVKQILDSIALNQVPQ